MPMSSLTDEGWGIFGGRGSDLFLGVMRFRAWCSPVDTAKVWKMSEPALHQQRFQCSNWIIFYTAKCSLATCSERSCRGATGAALAPCFLAPFAQTAASRGAQAALRGAEISRWGLISFFFSEKRDLEVSGKNSSYDSIWMKHLQKDTRSVLGEWLELC